MPFRLALTLALFPDVVLAGALNYALAEESENLKIIKRLKKKKGTWLKAIGAFAKLHLSEKEDHDQERDNWIDDPTQI